MIPWLKKTTEQQRHDMVAAARGPQSQRAVARFYGVPLSTVQYWLNRSAGQPLDQVDWSDLPRGPHQPHNRTPLELEDLILEIRRKLRDESDLGEYGATAVQTELLRRQVPEVPSLRTINRVFERRGALDGKRRIRHRPPPRGWYLPDVADGRAELDQFDSIEGLVIQDGPEVEVLTAVSLHGGLSGAWPTAGITAKIVRESLVEHWREFGLPAYAQFDNDTVFQGPHQHPDAIGSVTRLCLSLGVTPVFAPICEFGFQSADESFNGRWQAKVWARFHHATLDDLCERSRKYVAAHRQRTAARRERAPARRSFPSDWTLDLQAQPQGQIIFLRRTSEQGTVTLLGRTFEVASQWVHRLVRCEVDLERDEIRFYALRRRAPQEQPHLNTVAYVLPHRRFRE